jgi:hypothetical protein
MRRLVLLLTLATSTVVAADFRVATFGQSCNDLVKLEEEAGSTPANISPNNERSGRDFDVVALERRAQVSYLCTDGLLRAEIYLFPFETYSAVRETYNRSLSLLTKIYGPPNFESGAVYMPVPTLPLASWHTARLAIHLTIVATKPGRDNPYQITLTLADGHSKNRAESN